MTELAPWLFGLMVVAAAAIALVVVFGRRRTSVQEDSYAKGLELWLAGDQPGAITALRAAIANDPNAVDPYLQLGNLLRISGDAKRAMVLHRGLTVRNDIPQEKRLSISLALAEDLVALARWPEAAKVLEPLETHAASSPRFWRLRFAQSLGAGNEEAAARALQTGAARCSGGEAQEFQERLGFFQLDRCLRYCRAQHPGKARRLLKRVPATGALAARHTFVRALIATVERDIEAAVGIAVEGLLAAPQEMAFFLPALQEVLLERGQFARTVPILESACQAENAPASLWIALALLYEKLDERDKAIRLLENKAQDPRLTPDTAAPYLKLLAGEHRDTAFSRVWQTLHLTSGTSGWRCAKCGFSEPEVRWFCPSCSGFNSFTATAG